MPSCEVFYKDLLECLKQSDCVLVNKNTPKECLDKSHDNSVSKACRIKQQAYYECRINLLSPKKRFRGNYGGGSETKED
ncbi:hypothetical protein HDU92_005071 [Lobulomyces angularis]|nr:hypothetical protein HDU92_005071 [Lobulomyces angularis]